MPLLVDMKARADLGWDALLDHFARRCHTDRGAARARAFQPFASIEEAHARQAEVSEARALSDAGEGLCFGGVHDLEAALQRAEKGGILLPEELCQVMTTLMAGARLRRHLSERMEQAPRLLGRAAVLAELHDLSAAIADTFDESGAMRDTASPALRGLRQKVAALSTELSRRASALLAEGHVAPYLQDRFVTQREERYVVPIRADARGRVRGIVHGVSASGATVFIEPEEIIDLNNRLKLAQLEVIEEERRILGELSRRVQEAAPRITHNLMILTELDLIDAAARLSSDLRASPITLTEGGEIDLRNARHPLLHLAGVKVVPGDLRLKKGGTLLISGANAGGKTVALKTVGICLMMARCGMHAPVQEGSSLPAFDRVLTDVGDDQSLERSLSTFSAHILNLCRFLQAAGPEALILLDEVAAGTDPQQGAALAQAVLEALSDKGATGVVTTHYDRLKALPPADARFFSASVGYDMERMCPTYQLHLGTPGASGALMVARRLGLPEAIARRAEALLGERESGLEALLMSLSRERELLIEERRQLAAGRQQAERDRQAAAELLSQAHIELKRAQKRAHNDAIDALRRARVEMEELRQALKQQASRAGADLPSEIARAERRADQIGREIAAHAPEPELPRGRAPAPGELRAGRRVVVPRLGGTGLVLAEPVRGKVVVQVGALKLTVDAAELRLLDEEGERRREMPAGPFAQGPMRAGPSHALRTPATTLDLRGERVDAALGRAEKFVDDALRAGEGTVFLLHGHGTGALRSALRAHFASFPGVVRSYPASQADGGDGVTVLELDR